MQRVNIESKEIKSVGYCFCCSILEIEFHTDHTYQYWEVPLDVYTALLGQRLSSKAKTPSYGATFNRLIRDEVTRQRYLYTEVGPAKRDRKDKGQYRQDPDWLCAHD
jgi:hypothetical protein